MGAWRVTRLAAHVYARFTTRPAELSRSRVSRIQDGAVRNDALSASRSSAGASEAFSDVESRRLPAAHPELAWTPNFRCPAKALSCQFWMKAGPRLLSTLQPPSTSATVVRGGHGTLRDAEDAPQPWSRPTRATLRGAVRAMRAGVNRRHRVELHVRVGRGVAAAAGDRRRPLSRRSGGQTQPAACASGVRAALLDALPTRGSTLRAPPR